jgi:hypothetical protein
MTDEKKRIKKYLANKESFSFQDHSKHIQLVKEVTLEDVTAKFDFKKFRRMQCYLYHLDKLGITSREIAKGLEGKTMLIYRIIPRRISRRTKCPWCYAPVEDFYRHIKKAHGKTRRNIALLDFQKDLYTELLRIIRETEHYMSLAFINNGCQLCDDPVMEGRELCCSIPTSFRDRMRSLNHLGVTVSGVDLDFLQHYRYGQIILLP